MGLRFRLSNMQRKRRDVGSLLTVLRSVGIPVPLSAVKTMCVVGGEEFTVICTSTSYDTGSRRLL